MFHLFRKKKSSPARQPSFQEKELYRKVSDRVIDALKTHSTQLSDEAIRTICSDLIDAELDMAFDRWLEENLDHCTEESYSDEQIMSNVRDQVIGWAYDTQQKILAEKVIADVLADKQSWLEKLFRSTPKAPMSTSER